MNSTIQLILKRMIILLPLIAISSMAFLWHTAGELVHPDRRPLQPYHQDWFSHPAMHGVKVHRHACNSGKTPCLFIAPDSKSGAGQRGDILRSQLEDRQLSLKAFGETQGILVLLHGRNGRKEDLLPVAERFAAAGFKCAIPDLPAHGENPSEMTQFSTGKDEEDIVLTVLSDARKYFHDTNSPAGIWGLSMGGAYAVHAASRHPESWKAVVVVSSFDSLQNVLNDQLDWLPRQLSLSAEWVLSYMVRFRGGMNLAEVKPFQWAKAVALPVLIVHGGNDPLIAPKRGYKLYQAFSSQNKSWFIVPHADHNNILVTRAPVYAQMSQWFLTHVK